MGLYSVSMKIVEEQENPQGFAIGSKTQKVQKNKGKKIGRLCLVSVTIVQEQINQEAFVSSFHRNPEITERQREDCEYWENLNLPRGRERKRK